MSVDKKQFPEYYEEYLNCSWYEFSKKRALKTCMSYSLFSRFTELIVVVNHINNELKK